MRRRPFRMKKSLSSRSCACHTKVPLTFATLTYESSSSAMTRGDQYSVSEAATDFGDTGFGIRGSSWVRVGSSRLTSQFLSNHELETGPDVADGAYLYVDEADRQCQGADRVLRDIGGQLRCLLWPRHPNGCGFPHRGARAHEIGLQPGLAHTENMDDISGGADPGFNPDLRGQRCQPIPVPRRRVSGKNP